uniref:EF-hand domain-containing protein n=1 Tax=Neogobius melanostomus TaxID=47308 RepID=A0A8C6S4W1_9GOBI
SGGIGSTQVTVRCGPTLAVFDKYAGKDGNKDKLSKSEMKELIQDSKNPGQVDELFKCMDANGDDQLDFPEFMIALACLACICHGKECDMSKCKKHFVQK